MWAPLLLLLAALPQQCGGRLTAVWSDIENLNGGSHPGPGGPSMADAARTAQFVDLITNATAIAHAAHLRFAVDVNVDWMWEMSTDLPPRPFSEQVMSIVDEVTLMDYENECGGGGGGGGCDMEKALWLLAPWLSHSRWLQKSANHTCLVDTGLGLAFPGRPGSNTSHWNTSRAHTELELELSLRQGSALLHSLDQQYWAPSFSSLHRRFAVFEHLNYLSVSTFYPCPGDHVACATAGRPPRAIWCARRFLSLPLCHDIVTAAALCVPRMYDMVDDPARPQPLCSVSPAGAQNTTTVPVFIGSPSSSSVSQPPRSVEMGLKI